MSGNRPPLACASSRAASIWAGAFNRPKNWVVALPEIWLCRPLGDWVAKTSPSPYLRACEAQQSRGSSDRSDLHEQGLVIGAQIVTGGTVVSEAALEAEVVPMSG